LSRVSKKRKPGLVWCIEREAEKIRWLWKDRIPADMLTLIAGQPGLGKSQLLLHIAALATTGRAWPDGCKCPVGNVLLLPAEDPIANTIRPRFEEAGGDLNRLLIWENMTDESGTPGPIHLGRDIEILKEIIKDNDISLVEIDPLGSFMGKTDANRETAVRNVLYSVCKLAETDRCTFICNVHHNKGGQDDTRAAMERILGSIAFPGAARSVWSVSVDRDDPERYLFLPAKQNYGPSNLGGYEYFIKPAGDVCKVVWGQQECTITADESIKTGRTEAQTKINKVKRMILDALNGGVNAAKEIEETIMAQGVSKRTIARAKKELGVQSHAVRESGKTTAWLWSLE